MGILSRFKDIMEANVNELLDRAEDPAKMVDQTLRNLNEDLADVKKETALVIANEKRDQRAVDECKARIEKMDRSARNALKGGSESDARKLLEQKQAEESALLQLEKNLEISRANAERMKQAHDKLVTDINRLSSKRQAIKATVANAKAQEGINKLTKGANSSRSMEAFERMEQKANEMLDAANAEADLNAGTGIDSEKLADKWADGGDSSVDDALAAMKAEMGL